MKEKIFVDETIDGYAVKFYNQRLGIYTKAYCFPSLESCFAYIYKYMPTNPDLVESKVYQVEYKVCRYL